MNQQKISKLINNTINNKQQILNQINKYFKINHHKISNPNNKSKINQKFQK